jgi:TolB-like protein/Tfp pilus assembly protein PilF
MKGSGSANFAEFAGVFWRFRLYLSDERRNGQRLYRLDQAIGEVPIRLGNPGLRLLEHLLDHKGNSVSKRNLIRAAWEGKDNDGDREDNLRVEINKLRTGLGENAHNSCIQTYPEGYAYIPPEKPRHPLPLPPRLSIVVLPFADLSEDRGQQYFADGITADLTTDLSRLADMVVISRHTAFTYRDKPVDTKQIGRELGVRYVLEGSVRRSGNQVRVNVQLIDAEGDSHLWAERFDCNTDDLFALQTEITDRIAVALDLELVGAEAARRPEHPDALDYILRGRAVGYGKAPARENYAQAISLFESALALDPQSVQAKSWLAIMLASRVLDNMSDVAAADIERAEALVGQALATSPDSPQVHFAKGHVLRAQNRFEEAIPEYEAVLAFNRNWVFALAALGWCKFYTGSIEDALRVQEQRIRLSPRDPRIGNWYWRIGMIHLLQSRTEEATVWLEKARGANPRLAGPHAWLASAYALKGETSRAADELAKARRLSDDDRFSSITRFKTAVDFGPHLRALCECTYLAGLRQAGMPEQ